MLEPSTQVRCHAGSASAAPGLPDLLLIERARGADMRAVEALMRRYTQRLFRVARSVIPDDEGAEAAVQNALFAAFADLRRYEPTGKFAAWLTRLTLEEARARRAPVRPAGAVTPGQRQPLEAAIDALPGVFRTVFVLRLVEGISGTEAAAALGLNGTTVRTRLYRAHRRLSAGTDLGAAHAVFEVDGPRGDRIVRGALARLSQLTARS